MILIINLGSTTLKSQVRASKVDQILFKNTIQISHKPDWTRVWSGIINSLKESQIEITSIKQVLHRVVFGPEDILMSQGCNQFQVTNQLLDKLELTTSFAPLHNPISLSFVRFLGQFEFTSFLVFDNYLYRDIQPINYLYAVPIEWQQKYQIRKYGYHGLAHLSIQNQLKKVTSKSKMLSLQLGGGCSITVFENGRVVTNSMGFGTGDGLIMATRSGDIDSGALLHLLDVSQISPKELRNQLQKNSGLLALAGQEYGGDMRLILANLDNPHCQLALDMFVDRIVGYIGNYWLRFGGFDVVAFGGGIGEGSDVIRQLIISKLAILGVELDSGCNQNANEPAQIARISTSLSSAEVWVVPVDETTTMLRN